MRRFLDSHVSIGNEHTGKAIKCQDYAVTVQVQDNALLVLSDGCTSGGRTEVGAMLTCMSTVQVLMTENDPKVIAQLQTEKLLDWAKTMGVSLPSLQASRIYGKLNPNGGFIHLQGDGVVAIQYASGVTHMAKFSWKDERPAYPCLAQDGYAKFITAHSQHEKPFEAEFWTKVPGYSYRHRGEASYDVKEGIAGPVICFTKEQMEQIRLISIFSDGVTSFVNTDWRDVVMNLLDTPSEVDGGFVRRNLTLTRTVYGKKSCPPRDDISMAAMCFEEATVTEEQLASIDKLTNAGRSQKDLMQALNAARQMVGTAEKKLTEANGRVQSLETKVDWAKGDLKRAKEDEEKYGNKNQQGTSSCAETQPHDIDPETAEAAKAKAEEGKVEVAQNQSPIQVVYVDIQYAASQLTPEIQALKPNKVEQKGGKHQPKEGGGKKKGFIQSLFGVDYVAKRERAEKALAAAKQSLKACRDEIKAAEEEIATAKEQLTKAQAEVNAGSVTYQEAMEETIKAHPAPMMTFAT